ncbi:glucoamylase [Sinorhizobium meliloti]|uniref:glycoside hydrolase family 15 protein n=1 Tax=Rhizobium meliloti TaxID=382 RepID=UPI0001E4E29E|nr:glycoside hydrolase family 15 protein [Sinorhizobium meliloti]AEG07108.1 Glucan 1,4-alpha-glucosidase [Sinorhizobium meliloti BL225C]ASQ01901.1 glucoamylase [Sinorhizobium meliloti]ASQ12618.1 glucoamylase [Sinorhizobium meliloti]MCO6425987.1 glycoside hydrolase family 15 protein [Sinorhizobium meliloti]MDE3774661.1 glucoamylase [Sinorhizobium meliloti]
MTVAFRSKPVTVEDPAYRGLAIGAYAPAVTPAPAFAQTDLAALSRYYSLLMMRNITSDGYVIEDPASPGVFSVPGCVIAAPSYPANTPGVDQDYVFNWVRDGAMTAIEIALADLPRVPGGGVPSLIDYVNFAALCQADAKNSATATLGHACFTITGKVRPWSEQNDGPAIQSIAILTLFDQLDGATQKIAKRLVETNLSYLLEVYQNKTTNLWEEYEGYSFFARAVQLRFFREISRNTIGIAVPAGVADAISWLQNQLADHWNGQLYVSVLDVAAQAGYDANIDIVSSVCYGGIDPADTKLLATAAILRRQWADISSSSYFPINGADATKGLGPAFGRYPGDHYDGDVAAPVVGGHPWALCTANFAEFQYRLANAIDASGAIPLDQFSEPFFAELGLGASSSAAGASTALRASSDAMLRAIVYHSDHYELSEQFDGTTGYEKSVRNLTWSYASFLSAVRARSGGIPAAKNKPRNSRSRRS